MFIEVKEPKRTSGQEIDYRMTGLIEVKNLKDKQAASDLVKKAGMQDLLIYSVMIRNGRTLVNADCLWTSKCSYVWEAEREYRKAMEKAGLDASGMRAARRPACILGVGDLHFETEEQEEDAAVNAFLRACLTAGIDPDGFETVRFTPGTGICAEGGFSWKVPDFREGPFIEEAGRWERYPEAFGEACKEAGIHAGDVKFFPVYPGDMPDLHGYLYGCI